ncbi:hypothetical protein PC41400_16670 [Paenibacillus chitinolyticus]|uniref:Uncharacterized protein n=1 Tax=Paenibacillus chitinolyticus TaxID=79263 RepID=A0A410WXS1_9BACL|nr:hypothetical protein [Paenibacillus chitinolyticus]MCY9589851.1 hypothetical protein [Paenibacillus chitinolyticus]MCY9598148.1 hypothetical protein [Paenibacillus chitinolyticus]QAV19225.1 hypothetical protein PC41400_16670 [Paenibacillus chitinolyticus]
MKSSLYYHPQRVIVKDSAIILNSAHYMPIKHFVGLLEEKVPQCIHDLKNLTVQYSIATEWSLEKGLTGLEDPSLWEIVNQSDENNSFAGYLPLKKGLIEWINKYKLFSSTGFYLSLALWSVEVYYKQCLETEREKRIAHMKKTCEELEISEAQYWVSFPYEPNKEVLSLSKEIVYANERDTEALYESTENITEFDDLFFDQNFPFIFAPNQLYLILNGDPSIDDFEDLKPHSKNEEDYKPNPANSFSGYGWDPREDSWREYEKRIDCWYEKYKHMYKERTESILYENGYVRSKAKRNIEHYSWLVYYQILGWSLKDIANHWSEKNESAFSEDTIWKGLKSAAEIVYINLR